MLPILQSSTNCLKNIKSTLSLLISSQYKEIFLKIEENEKDMKELTTKDTVSFYSAQSNLCWHFDPNIKFHRRSKVLHIPEIIDNKTDFSLLIQNFDR